MHVLCFGFRFLVPQFLNDHTFGSCKCHESSQLDFDCCARNADLLSKEKLRERLKFRLMNPFEKWNCPKHRRFPWKLLVQIICVILATAQVGNIHTLYYYAIVAKNCIYTIFHPTLCTYTHGSLSCLLKQSFMSMTSSMKMPRHSQSFLWLALQRTHHVMNALFLPHLPMCAQRIKS